MLGAYILYALYKKQELIKLAYVYKIVNDINQKVYVGLTFISLQHRWKTHLADKNFKDRPLYRAMNKYGVEHFSIELIEECDDSIVNDREIYWIHFFNSYHNGYNATLGGEGRMKYDKEEVLSLYRQGHTLREICNILHCDSSIPRKILKSYNIDTLKNQNDKNRELYGKKCQAISKTDNTILFFDTMFDGAAYIKENHLSVDSLQGIHTHISQVCNGKRKSAYGFKWNFI